MRIRTRTACAHNAQFMGANKRTARRAHRQHGHQPAEILNTEGVNSQHTFRAGFLSAIASAAAATAVRLLRRTRTDTRTHTHTRITNMQQPSGSSDAITQSRRSLLWPPQLAGPGQMTALKTQHLRTRSLETARMQMQRLL